MKPWRFEIKHGPEGEANYAWVYDHNNEMVCTAKTHHAKQIVDALRRLAAPDQKPVAYCRCHDDVARKYCLDKDRCTPIAEAQAYLSPPPAAGWDEAIEAAAQIAVRYCVSPQCASDIRALTKSPVVNDYLTTRLEDEQLDAPVKLTVVSWEGRIHCAYINNHRIAGGKPWAGGTTEKEWSTSLREVIRALPDLQKALGFDYLGRSALRHNAPPDSGAGESEPVDAGERISKLAADLVISGWMARASSTEDVELRKKEAERKLLAFACDEIERHMKRDPSVMPDHGGADAGVRERIELRDMLQNCRDWLFVAYYDADSLTAARAMEALPLIDAKIVALSHQPAPVEKPVPRAENDPGRCFMAASTICENIADTEGDPSGAKSGSKYLEGFYDGAVRCATVLREKITEPPAPVDANAGAEARLREALESCKVEHLKFNEWAAGEKYEMHEHPLHYLFLNEKTDAARQGWKAALRYVQSVLSQHPHASDCDKQGER